MKEILAVAAIILIIVAYTPYIQDTLKGKTRPHAYSWFISALVTFIAFGLQISAGAGWTSIPTLVAAVAGGLIFCLSLGPRRVPITKSDTFFFAMALIAMGFWLIADQPIISVVLISLIDTLAFAPTFRKSWNRPDQETSSAYAVNAIRFTISAFAVQSYSFVTVFYPLSQALTDICFVLFLSVRKRALIKKQVKETPDMVIA